jgi:hypothetical protein
LIGDRDDPVEAVHGLACPDDSDDSMPGLITVGPSEARKLVRTLPSDSASMPAKRRALGQDSNIPHVAKESIPSVRSACEATSSACSVLAVGGIALELGAGCARLTRCLIDAGFAATGVDWKRNKSKPEGPCALVDLTKVEGRDLILQVINQKRVVFVHAAPPCGTASRCRERPLPPELVRKGCPQPRPLRSESLPEGLPHLHDHEQIRVDSANRFYESVALILERCHSLKIRWSCENPFRSLMWKSKWFSRLLALPGVFFTGFRACMHGGERDKKTAFAHNIEAFKELEAECSKDHEHKPWSAVKTSDRWRFDTELEAEYPLLLCQRMVQKLVKDLQNSGFEITTPVFCIDSEPSLASTPSSSPSAAAAAGRQARGAKGPRMVPEFADLRKVIVAEAEASMFDEGFVCRTDVTMGSVILQKGHKLIRKHNKMDEIGCIRCHMFWAVPWEPVGFLKRAQQIGHPVDNQTSLDPSVYQNVFDTLTSSAADTVRFRKQQLMKYEAIAASLADEEMKLHKAMDPDIERIMAKKKLLLFKRMAKDVGSKDKNLMLRLVSGFQITGELDFTGELEEVPMDKVKKRVDKYDLLRTSRWTRSVALSSMKSSGDQRVDEEVYSKTLEEVAEGAVRGPFHSVSEVSTFLGSDLWIASRRFGVVQGEKIRCCDDLSEYNVNSTACSLEKLRIGGVDELVANASLMASAVKDDRSIRIPDGRGGWLVGVLHDDWSLDESRQIVGRTVDLAKAYKQLTRCKSDAAFTVLLVFNPFSCKAEFFLSVALNFGAIGAVYGFYRPAIVIRLILSRLFRIVVSNFFDDFLQLDFQRIRGSSAVTILKVSDLLGWEVSAKKLRPDLEAKFPALGVEVDLSGTVNNRIVVSNTESRKASIDKEINAILKSMVLQAPHAASLKGRLVFSEGQLWSRCGALTSVHLGERARAAGGLQVLTHDLHQSLLISQWITMNGAPRVITPRTVEECTFVFTDGAAEGEENASQKVTCGGVIFTPRLALPQYFCYEVPLDVVQHWHSSGSTHVIAQAELLPVVMAKMTWRSLLFNSRVVYFIDNESAKDGLIRANSAVWTSRELILHSVLCDAISRNVPWYARVPSAANLADGPSRFNFELMNKIGAVQCTPVSLSLSQMKEPDVIGILNASLHIS